MPARDDQVVHARGLPDGDQAGVADPAVRGVGAAVVGDPDHRVEHGAVRGARQMPAELAQAPDEQHRLDDARGHVAPVGGKTAQSAVGVDQRERRHRPPPHEAAGRAYAPGGRERVRLEDADDAAPARAGHDANPGTLTGVDAHAPRAAVGGRVEQRAVAVAGPLEALDAVEPGARAQPHSHGPLADAPEHHPAATADVEVRHRSLHVDALRQVEALAHRERAAPVRALRPGGRHRQHDRPRRGHDEECAPVGHGDHGPTRCGWPYRRGCPTALDLTAWLA